jgi:hypothetical protein
LERRVQDQVMGFRVSGFRVRVYREFRVRVFMGFRI